MQVLGADGNIVREVTVTRALLKGGSGAHKRSVRSRRVVLNERARGVIRDYIASLGRVSPADEYLFRSRSGVDRPISGTQAHRILKDLCEDCGIDATRISTHSLRKSFVRAVQTELDEIVLGLGSPTSTPAAARALALASCHDRHPASHPGTARRRRNATLGIEMIWVAAQ